MRALTEDIGRVEVLFRYSVDIGARRLLLAKVWCEEQYHHDRWFTPEGRKHTRESRDGAERQAALRAEQSDRRVQLGVQEVYMRTTPSDIPPGTFAEAFAQPRARGIIE